MMPTATLREFQRRLQAEGFEHEIDELGGGPVRNGEQYIYVFDSGEIQYKRESASLAMRVRAIRDEVEEYMGAFLTTVPRVSGAASDTRTLLLFQGCELAGRRHPDGSMDFVTWAHVRGHRDMGHYHENYAAAKEDFAVRAGLIDRDRLFTETELTVIRSNLSDYLTIDGGDHITGEQEAAITGVIKKIDQVVVPEIQDQTRDAEDQGYEPEIEL